MTMLHESKQIANQIKSSKHEKVLTFGLL